MMRAVALALMLLLSACGGGSDKARVEHAWVRLSPIPDRPAAAYFVVHGGPRPSSIVAVDSPDAQRGELHDSREAGGMMTMAKLASVPLPAKDELRFAPGGYHVMLFGVAPSVRAGGTMPLTIRIQGAPPIRVEAKVVAPADPAPA